MENMYDNHTVPPGYRFYPTEEELVEFYLRNKLEGKRNDDIQRVIPVINIYHHNPSELPEMAGEVIKRDTEQWFFFIPIQDREARGGRPTRLTTQGYWKATGTPGYVYSSNNKIIGGKRTMVFYKGRAPNGKKTQWKMNEYKASVREASVANNVTNLKLQHEFSLCRVYKKSKCVRAFDRRPAGSGINEGLLLPSHQPINVDHDHQAAPSTYQNNDNRIIGTSSLESSSSGEHNGENPQPMGSLDDLSENIWDFDWNYI
ncbi:NAC domain-containing protein 90-like [Lycium barbarum]|uniref:NAC domain-containing protein 90-like n=1 Tax=Lycium barbarum TaxID=112863 RepID=UPI00293EAB77|nr:NAC domain-containing protein 90-like [Lycium barbarum]